MEYPIVGFKRRSMFTNIQYRDKLALKAHELTRLCHLARTHFLEEDFIVVIIIILILLRQLYNSDDVSECMIRKMLWMCLVSS